MANRNPSTNSPKGGREYPRKYWPIGVVSHASNAVESAIIIAVRKHYKFWETQLRFEERTSTEKAITRHTTATRNKKIGAVLDLRSPYDKVSRSLMMDLVKLKLPQHFPGMIAATLQPLKLVTTGGDRNTIRKLRRRVTYGSPLSPTLFSIFVAK